MRSRCASSSLPWSSSSASRTSSSASMPRDRLLHALGAGDVVRRGEDRDLGVVAEDLARERVERAEALDLVAEQLDADRVLLVDRDDLDRVATDPEGPAGEGDVVARVLDVDELAQQGVAVDGVADLEPHHALDVLLGGAEPVDARDRGHHDDVATGEQAVGGRVPQPLDLLVDRGVLLDVGVGLAGRRPRAGSSRSTRRSTRPRCWAAARGTRWRAAPRASCWARGPAWVAAAARSATPWWPTCPCPWPRAARRPAPPP